MGTSGSTIGAVEATLSVEVVAVKKSGCVFCGATGVLVVFLEISIVQRI